MTPQEQRDLVKKVMAWDRGERFSNLGVQEVLTTAKALAEAIENALAENERIREEIRVLKVRLSNFLPNLTPTEDRKEQTA